MDNSALDDIFSRIDTYFQLKTDGEIEENIGLQREKWSDLYNNNPRFRHWFQTNYEDFIIIKEGLIDLINPNINIRSLALLMYEYY